jgi:hypothetical protein
MGRNFRSIAVDYASKKETSSSWPQDLKGAQIPSRRETVLVNHPAESIATLDSRTAPIGMSCCTPRVRWRQSQAPMRPMDLGVVNEDTKHRHRR